MAFVEICDNCGKPFTEDDTEWDVTDSARNRESLLRAHVKRTLHLACIEVVDPKLFSKIQETADGPD